MVKRINLRQKMYKTNSKIRQALINNGFEFLYFFPHLRFQKDYFLDGSDFDALGFKKGEKNVYFMQFKTNKKLPKKELVNYVKIESKYHCKCLWITFVNRKGVFLYSSDNPKGIIMK